MNIYLYIYECVGLCGEKRRIFFFLRNSKCVVMIETWFLSPSDFSWFLYDYSRSVRTACWVEDNPTSLSHGRIRKDWQVEYLQSHRCGPTFDLYTSVSLNLLFSFTNAVGPLIPHCAVMGGWTACWRRRSRQTHSGRCWRWPADRAGSAWAGCVWRTCQSSLPPCRPTKHKDTRRLKQERKRQPGGKTILIFRFLSMSNAVWFNLQFIYIYM